MNVARFRNRLQLSATTVSAVETGIAQGPFSLEVSLGSRGGKADPPRGAGARCAVGRWSISERGIVGDVRRRGRAIRDDWAGEL